MWSRHDGCNPQIAVGPDRHSHRTADVGRKVELGDCASRRYETDLALAGVAEPDIAVGAGHHAA